MIRKMIQKMIQKAVRTVRGEISTSALVRRGLKVGKNFNRQGQCIIDPPHCWLIEIGDNVTLATGVYILAHDASTKNILGYAKIGNIKIGNNVFIGARSIIMPNTTIGDNSIIGSGSIVTKNVPKNTVVAGNPAKIICTLDEYKKKMINKMTEDNVFDESYTERKSVTEDKKQIMKDQLEKHGIGFVE